MFKTKTLSAIILIILLSRADCQKNSDEDSGSIEIPNRPENRQEHKELHAKPEQDRASFLNLLAKLMDNLKSTVQNSVRRRVGTKKAYKTAVHKTKRTLCSLHKAYAYADKAKKIFLKNVLPEPN